MLRTFSTYVEHIQNNIRAFSTHVEWSKLHRFSFVAHICLHILFLRVEMLHKINSTIFTSLLDTHTFYLHSQPSTHWFVRKYWEEEELWIVLLSLFLWCFQHRLFQGGNRSKKRYDRFTWLLMLLVEYPCLLSAAEAGSGPPGSPGPSGTGSSCRPCLEPHWALMPCGLTGTLCRWGIGHALCKQSGKEQWAHLLSTT